MGYAWLLEHEKMELCIGKCISGKYSLVTVTSKEALKFGTEEEALNFKHDNIFLLERLQMSEVFPNENAQ